MAGGAKITLTAPGDVKKQVLTVFAVTVTIYVAAFAFDQHLRSRNGPWQLTFEAATNGFVTVQIDAPRLGVSNVVVSITGATVPEPVPSHRMTFDQPLQKPPFGKLLFEDLTYLPGTLSFDLFGHEVEMLPRVLTVDRREYPWSPGLRIELSPDHKPPPRPPTRKNRRFGGG